MSLLLLAGLAAAWERPTSGLDAWSPFAAPCVEEGRCGWQRTSDGLFLGAWGLGAAGAATWGLAGDGAWREGRWQAGPTLGWAAGAGVVVAATELTKRVALRPRPYTWSDAWPEAYGAHERADADHSFWSGHTAGTAYNLGYLAASWHAWGPRGPGRVPGVVAAYGLAAAGTALVGVARVEAGKHHVSDVLVGGLVGAGVGVVVPWLVPHPGPAPSR